jgi:hypothetical protein
MSEYDDAVAQAEKDQPHYHTVQGQIDLLADALANPAGDAIKAAQKTPRKTAAAKSPSSKGKS